MNGNFSSKEGFWDQLLQLLERGYFGIDSFINFLFSINFILIALYILVELKSLNKKPDDPIV